MQSRAQYRFNSSVCLSCSLKHSVVVKMAKHRLVYVVMCITGYSVAQHCCNYDQQCQWENRNFDPL